MGLRLALGETVANIECRALSVFAQPYALKAVIAGLDPAIHHSRGAQTSLRRAGARVVACSPPPAPSLLPPYKVGGGPLNRVTLAYSRRQLVVNAAIAAIWSLFSLRPSELIQGFLMQDPNLSQVSLRFFNAVLYGVQLFPNCNLTSMIQRGFEALDAKCSKSGKGISLCASLG
jgi:hypothetical protein